MNKVISQHCKSLPPELNACLDAEFEKVQRHYLLREWDDLQVDAGRLCEAMLRVLEWKMGETYTPIDGKNKPNRQHVINSARKDISLPSSMRMQLVGMVEMIMDFRNNRNSAHLGNIDPNQIDANTVYQLVLWMVGELIRLDSTVRSPDVQAILTTFSEKPVPLVYRIDGQPIVLAAELDPRDVVLVLLYDSEGPVDVTDLFRWSKSNHVTRWRQNVLGPLEQSRMIHLSKGMVYILPPGSQRAEELIRSIS